MRRSARWSLRLRRRWSRHWSPATGSATRASASARTWSTLRSLRRSAGLPAPACVSASAPRSAVTSPTRSCPCSDCWSRSRSSTAATSASPNVSNSPGFSPQRPSTKTRSYRRQGSRHRRGAGQRARIHRGAVGLRPTRRDRRRVADPHRGDGRRVARMRRCGRCRLTRASTSRSCCSTSTTRCLTTPRPNARLPRRSTTKSAWTWTWRPSSTSGRPPRSVTTPAICRASSTSRDSAAPNPGGRPAHAKRRGRGRPLCRLPRRL